MRELCSKSPQCHWIALSFSPDVIPTLRGLVTDHVTNQIVEKIFSRLICDENNC